MATRLSIVCGQEFDRTIFAHGPHRASADALALRWGAARRGARLGAGETDCHLWPRLRLVCSGSRAVSRTQRALALRRGAAKLRRRLGARRRRRSNYHPWALVPRRKRRPRGGAGCAAAEQHRERETTTSGLARNHATHRICNHCWLDPQFILQRR